MLIIIYLLLSIIGIMPVSSSESEKQSIETSDSSELQRLKENIIQDTINEITGSNSGFFSKIKKKILNKYLTNGGKWRERVEDTLIEAIGGKLITKEIKEFKENLSKASSERELEELKDSILESIKAQTSTQTATSASHTSTSSSTATTTSRTSSSTSSTTNSSGATSSTSSTSTSSPEYTSSTAHYEIDKFNINVTQEHKDMYNQLKGVEKPDLEPFACAMKGYEEIKGSLRNPTYLTVVDFTKPNDRNRFYVINMNTKRVEYATPVGHGSGSGRGAYATDFSNINGSYQSSLGFFRTPDHTNKPLNRKRRGLLMNGIEGSNNKAASRGIYMHPGGKISLGCFTIPSNESSEIMNKVKGDSLLFAYAKSKDYFSQSQYFNTSSTGDVLAA